MPADILATDTLFPELNGKETTDQKFEMVTDYLWLLREQLTFALTNLGVANFNASQLQKLGNTLSEPFAVMIAEQDKKFAAFQVTIDGINGTISNLDETFMKQTDFSVTSNGVKVTIGETTSELASVSKLTSTANSLNSTITSVRSTANTAKSTADSAKSTADSAKSTADNVSNNYISKSSATQTASGFDLEVMNSTGAFARASLTANGLTLRNNSGTTVLSADTSGNLKVTGTITGSEIYGSTFTTLASSNASTSGYYATMSGSGLELYRGGLLSGVRLPFSESAAGTGDSSLELWYSGSLYGWFGYDIYSGSVAIGSLNQLNLFSSLGLSIRANEITIIGSLYINGVYFQPA